MKHFARRFTESHWAAAAVSEFQSFKSDSVPNVFYTGKGWSFSQDQQECPASDSDVPEFYQRHFIRSPVQRIGKNGWAPIKLTCSKTVGTTFKGRVLKDAYEISGFAIFRVKTARGNYDSKIDIRVTAEATLLTTRATARLPRPVRRARPQRVGTGGFARTTTTPVFQPFPT
jgi:hypothetical protein